MLARNHLSRHGEQIHVRLDVHVVGDGIDAPEGVRDLPVEVPEELLMIVSTCVGRIRGTLVLGASKLTSTNALCISIIAICLPRHMNRPLPNTTSTVCRYFTRVSGSAWTHRSGRKRCASSPKMTVLRQSASSQTATSVPSG